MRILVDLLLKTLADRLLDLFSFEFNEWSGHEDPAAPDRVPRVKLARVDFAGVGHV